MLANAEQMRYSPWSGMQASFMPGQSLPSAGSAALGAGIQGGLQGAMMGQQFSKGMAKTPEVPGAADSPWGAMTPRKSTLFNQANPNEFMLGANNLYGMRS